MIKILTLTLLLFLVGCEKEVIIDKHAGGPTGETTINVNQETNVNVDNNAEVNVNGESSDKSVLAHLCKSGPITITYLEVDKDNRTVYAEYKCSGDKDIDHSDHDHDEDENCPEAENGSGND